MSTVQQEVTRRTVNVGLRLASAGSRFALLIVLARLMSPGQVGTYGLFLSTVLLGVALLGLEFHAYGLRELMREERSRWSFVIQQCAIAWLLSYAILTPILWLVSEWWQIDGISPLWLFSVIAAEHLCQETSRLLVAMGRPLLASALMFLRMGAWTFVVIPWMWLDPSARRLELVFAAWLVGAVVALLASAAAILKEARPWKRWDVSWSWIRSGLGVAGMYLIGTFVYRWIFAADRYLVQYLDGSERLGVYVLYIGLATSIITILEPAIISFLHPRLVSAWQHGDRPKYEKTFASLRLSILGLSSALVLTIVALAPFILHWIGKPDYSRDLPLLWILLAMVWIYSNTIPLDSALYARRRDKEIMYTMIGTMLLFIAVVPLASHWLPQYSVAVALLVAFSVAHFAKRALLHRAVAHI